jgi:hypothetical protein
LRGFRGLDRGLGRDYQTGYSTARYKLYLYVKSSSPKGGGDERENNAYKNERREIIGRTPHKWRTYNYHKNQYIQNPGDDGRGVKQIIRAIVEYVLGVDDELKWK